MKGQNQMKKNGLEQAGLFSLFLLGGLILVLSFYEVFVRGWLNWHIQQKEVWSLFPELLLLFFAFFASLTLFTKKREQWGALILLFSGFCWIYVTWIPLFLAACYMVFLFFHGAFLRIFVFRITLRMSAFLDFLLGVSSLLCLFCLMSAFQLGSIRNLRLAVAVLFVAELIFFLLHKKEKSEKKEGILPKLSLELAGTRPQAACFSAALTFFCIQIGRMNRTIDYDSIWYGLRSEFVLDPNHGIYENLQLPGAVYTYPKGLETLLLPISGLPSYAFLYAFELMLALLCAVVGYRIVSFFVGEQKKSLPMLAVLLISATPAVMNMAITAKTDLMTMLLQLLMVYFWLYYIRSGERSLMTGAWMAYLLSFLMKPTAPVFSTAIMGMSLCYFLWKRCFFSCIFLKNKEKNKKRTWALLFPVAGAFLGITARTWLMVGVPMTSSFGPLFQKLGFVVKYPYRVDQFNQIGSQISIFSKEGQIQLWERMYGMWIAPVTENMDHVVIAWGGVLSVFLILAVLFLKTGKKEQTQVILGKDYLKMVCIPYALVNLVIMALLRKPDGNYFMTCYVLIILYFCIELSEYPEKKRKKMTGMLIPYLIYSMILCVVTNWSMSIGFNEAHLISRQYYQSQMMEKVKLSQQGMEQIWDYLEDHPGEKGIGFGDHEYILRFPGILESYLDLTYWGNSHLTDTTEEFIEYIRKADISFFIIDWEFERENRPEEVERLKLLAAMGVTETILEEGRYELVGICQ